MYRCLKVCFGYCVLLATSSAFASCARSADEPPEVTRTESGNDTHRDTINRSQAEITPSAWDEAAASIRHLAPSVFTEAPAAVRNHLIEDGCTVPQAYNDSTRHNVISGEFAAPGQIDWAALCTRGDSAGIVIVWGGPVRCPSPIA